MLRNKYPLIQLALFRNRAFATINLSTLLIYGALYASAGFQALFLQGVLGYTPLGAAIIGLPSGILLTLLSTRVGTLSGRLGVRPFLLTYAVGLAQYGYDQSPLEAIAYELQEKFEHGTALTSVPQLVALHAVDARNSAATVFEMNGLKLGA